MLLTNHPTCPTCGQIHWNKGKLCEECFATFVVAGVLFTAIAVAVYLFVL